MAKLRELLQFRSLKQLQLVTEEESLDTNIGTVTVMEVPDVIQWLRGEDFLITSLYSIGDDEEKQCELLCDLIDSQSSCLAIKTGKYAKSICQKMINIANDNHFPLLRIPYEMTYIDIIMDAMNVLMTESNRRAMFSKYISQIIFPAASSERMLVEEGHLLKIDLEKDYFQAIAVSADMESVLAGTEYRTIKYAMEKLMGFTEELSEVISGGYFRMERGVILMLCSKERQALEQYIPFVLTELKLNFQNMSLPFEWKIGIGTVRSTVDGIRQSYLQAIQAIEIGKVLKKPDMQYRFEDLELYANLQSMLQRKEGSFLGDKLESLKNQELVDTLMVYYEYNGNLDEIAGRMYTHKNTIKYRLNKIKELTGLDVKCQEDNFKLYFMVLEKKLRHRQI